MKSLIFLSPSPKFPLDPHEDVKSRRILGTPLGLCGKISNGKKKKTIFELVRASMDNL